MNEKMREAFEAWIHNQQENGKALVDVLNTSQKAIAENTWMDAWKAATAQAAAAESKNAEALEDCEGLCRVHGITDTAEASLCEVFYQRGMLLATAAERERAALVCEAERVEDTCYESDFGYNMAIGHCATAIRQGGAG